MFRSQARREDAALFLGVRWPLPAYGELALPWEARDTVDSATIIVGPANAESLRPSELLRAVEASPPACCHAIGENTEGRPARGCN